MFDFFFNYSNRYSSKHFEIKYKCKHVAKDTHIKIQKNAMSHGAKYMY